MSYGYGGRANPYAQQDSPTTANYGAPPQQSYGYGNNVEMAPLSQSGAAFGAGNPTNVLNEIRDIGNGVNGIEQNLQQLRMLQDRALNETDSNSGTSRQLDQLSADTMASYRELVQRVRELKSKPDARSYQGQVDRIDRQLKSAIQQFQEVESSHRQKMQGQMERQYRIVRPDADQNEVRAAVEDMSTGGQQVFQQAMMQSNRQGQARAVLNEVQNRHRELLKIEQQMTELAQLMQDLDTIIIQQEEPLMKIEQQAEDTVQQLEEANVHLDKANESARATRRKKWICLGICVLIVVIIVVIVVVYFVVTNKNSSNNTSTTNTARGLIEIYTRSLAPLDKVPGAARSIAGRYVLPAVDQGSTARIATLPVAMPGAAN